MAVRLTN